MLKAKQDAFGQAILDWRNGSRCPEIIERDDGLIDAYNDPGGLGRYYDPFRKWPKPERQAIRYVRGRVLDIGCGPGRTALYLQEKGCEVVAVDNSPGMIKAAKLEGVRDARVLAMNQISPKLGVFDTIVMYGHNFGLMGSLAGGRKHLRKFHRMTSERGRIVASAGDAYNTTDPDHLWYHGYNRRRGRSGGQLKLRIRHRKLVTPWFDYLFLSPEELEKMVDGTGWKVTKMFRPGGVTYTFVLEKV